MYPAELEMKYTTESDTSASSLDWLWSIGRDGQLHTSLYDKRDDFHFHITNFPFLSSNIPSSSAYGSFISQLIRYVRDCSSNKCFILRAVRFFNELLGQGYCKGTFEIVSKEDIWLAWGFYQTIWGPPLPNVTRHSGWCPYTVTLSIDQALHQFLTPLQICTLLSNLTLYLTRGYDRTTGATCQQRTLTPTDTWSFPSLGLASVLMLWPISPELVLFPDFLVSNIPRYLFCSCSSLNADLFRVNLTEFPSCRCGHLHEDVFHYLFHCRFTMTKGNHLAINYITISPSRPINCSSVTLIFPVRATRISC